jgi:hypothetical protein
MLVTMTKRHFIHDDTLQMKTIGKKPAYFKAHNEIKKFEINLKSNFCLFVFLTLINLPFNLLFLIPVST